MKRPLAKMNPYSSVTLCHTNGWVKWRVPFKNIMIIINVKVDFVCSNILFFINLYDTVSVTVYFCFTLFPVFIRGQRDIDLGLDLDDSGYSRSQSCIDLKSDSRYPLGPGLSWGAGSVKD